MPTLARKFGTTEHLSPLLRKARRLGLTTVRDLEQLAVVRGCNYYRFPDTGAPLPTVSTEALSNEELAIALLHGSQPWNPQTLRIGAAMTGAHGSDPRQLARLAIMERCGRTVRQIALAGKRFEPTHPFWDELLAALPVTPAAPEGVLPHPTRYVALTGLTSRGRESVATWIRPQALPIR